MITSRKFLGTQKLTSSFRGDLGEVFWLIHLQNLVGVTGAAQLKLVSKIAL